MRKFFILGIAVFLLTGCASLTPWTEMKKADYRDTGRGFTATIPTGWMRCNYLKFFLITRDGLSLNRIAVEKSKPDTKLDFTKKRFALDMTPQDLAEVEIDDCKSNPNIKNLKLVSNTPAEIDGKNAFRIEMLTTDQNGLKERVIEYGFIADKFIYIIGYGAPQQYYFTKYFSDFEKFLASFKLIGAKK
jgi:hypothetical protein